MHVYMPASVHEHNYTCVCVFFVVVVFFCFLCVCVCVHIVVIPYSSCVLSLDINECNMTTIPCDTHAACTNTPGSYSCQCMTGYTGNGTSCDGNQN